MQAAVPGSIRGSGGVQCRRVDCHGVCPALPGACGAARPSRTAAAGVSPAVHGSAGHCEADSELPGAEKIHSGGEPLPGLVGRHGTFGKTKTAGDMRTGGKEPGLFHPQRVSACLFFSAACSAPSVGLCDGGRRAGTPEALFVPSGQNLCGQMWLSVPSVPGQAQLCLGPAAGFCQNRGRNIGRFGKITTAPNIECKK